ncbi:ABC transporter ATP-binding protein [Alicyclobacillus sp. SO9]|uniref:ABC transporter ATP-binding protein n=1 Tax=Alicyclobacillus sp. SO9 TaxID=2665646 RepID=UPI0018E72ED0|nr:ATP-binding cassette domain-containing protein [Alicyclobacillus sp. SO9]QQE79849.1 ATP-binding cassette domain-containing protein [Alicyclobacillus sp. SO9]
MIRVSRLTKTFSNGKGIFNLDFEVNQGEVFGFLGPNGAGKSTTIRHLMGFLKADEGTATISERDCWAEAAENQTMIGYLPGEMEFLEGMTGSAFLRLLGDMRGMKQTGRRDALMERFQLDTKPVIRKMSKGTKQKLGIVAAFMHNPEILILDEPTSGLDPLMQQEFLSLVLEERSKGKTILMSSHVFQEVERVADRVGFIKDGRMVSVNSIEKWREQQPIRYTIWLAEDEDVSRIVNSGVTVLRQDGLSLQVEVRGNLKELFATLSECNILRFESHALGLEDTFMHLYDQEVTAK